MDDSFRAPDPSSRNGFSFGTSPVGGILAVLALLAAAGCGDPSRSVGPQDDGGADSSASPDAWALGCAADGCADPAAPHCDLAADRCVACLEASDCGGAGEALCLGGVCSPCLTDTQCADQTGQPFCRSDGRCVTCLAVDDCSLATPHCMADGRCVECVDDAACSDIAPICEGGTCHSCADASCTAVQQLQELVAAQCVHGIQEEGESQVGDGFEALFCSERADLFDAFGYIERAVEDGRVDIDPEGFTQCRAVDAEGLFGDEGPCASVLRGMVDDGGACALASECASGRCDAPRATCAGTCLPPAAAGSPCDGSRDCAERLICEASLCQLPPIEGAPCRGRCADGLYCDAARLCAPKLGEGGACGTTATTGACQDDFVCRSRRCTADRPRAGEACWPAHLRPRCAEGLRCDGTTCGVPAAVGAACASTTECALGARCAEGACATILLPGAHCTMGDPCALGTGCQSGRCRPLPDVGEVCFAAGCLRGVCQDGTCQARPTLSACEPGLYVFDVLDPCGSSSSCTDTASGWLCTAEGGLGAACGGVADAPCRQPGLYCGPARTCIAHCLSS